MTGQMYGWRIDESEVYENGKYWLDFGVLLGVGV